MASAPYPYALNVGAVDDVVYTVAASGTGP